MIPGLLAAEGTWSRLTNVFGTCLRCGGRGRPLFRYQLESGHLSDVPWHDKPVCNIEYDDFEGCYWCAWPAEQPFMVCPRCFGEAAAEERVALDAALTELRRMETAGSYR